MAFDKTAYLAAAQKDLDSAQALMSDADRDEAKIREEGEAKREAAKAAKAAKRTLDLKRRLEDAEAKNPGLALRPLEIEEFTDTFIIQRDGAAHGAFEKAVQSAGTDKNFDMLSTKCEYAIQVVHDWNGLADWDAANGNGLKLRAFLTANPAVVTTIVAAALSLNGAVARERKS